VVSGSCSPTTERQIRHALAHGFAGIALDPRRLAGEGAEHAIAEAVDAGLAALGRGESPLVHTALGPATDRGAELDAQPGARHAIGRALGHIQHRLVREGRVRRAVIAGGDTSSHALRELDVFALTTLMPLPDTPGSPLCHASSADAALDGLQVALKGGQVGGDDYFVRIRNGQP
jgi:3-oxoisoapionate kinase